MNRIIFVVHGIRSRQEDNWIYQFIDFAKADPRFEDDIFIPYYYGFVLATGSIIPTFKYRMVKRLRRAIREETAKYPGYELNIVAHSYGTELSFWAIKTSGEDTVPPMPIMVNRLILVASVVLRSYHIPYNDTLRDGKIKQLHCYCSYNDEVCNFAPFGHSGCFGFSRDEHDSTCYPKPFDDLEIYNHQAEIAEHGDYFKGTKFYEEWLNLIC
jgi:pimeloyl-ACP methyl ester carboxylesterase